MSSGSTLTTVLGIVASATEARDRTVLNGLARGTFIPHVLAIVSGEPLKVAAKF